MKPNRAVLLLAALAWARPALAESMPPAAPEDLRDGDVEGAPASPKDLRARDAEAAPGSLRAGAASVDVTPRKLPVRVNGGITERLATAVKDPLHARCLVLEESGQRIAIAVVDSCLMPRDLLDEAKRLASEKASIPTDRMLISATHTHTAPAVMGVHGTDPEPEYREFLKERIAECIIRASANLAPARIGWAAGRCDEHVFCRRWLMQPGSAQTVPFTGCAENRAQMNPGNANANRIRPLGPVDPSVTVLSAVARDGRPIALLANYSTHYAGSSQISADYFGEFSRIVEERLGARGDDPPFVAMMSNGTSGDANCIDFSPPERRPFTHIGVARSLAEAALAALKSVEYADSSRLRMEEETLTLGVRLPAPDEVAEAQAYLDEHAKDRPVRTIAENYARETVLLGRMGEARELKLQAIRIGGFAIAAIPCEVYGVTGLEIKKRSPFSTTMTISMANGAEGYIPPEDQFPLGGYTTWRARSSCLEVEAEGKIRRKLLEMLERLSSGP